MLTTAVEPDPALGDTRGFMKTARRPPSLPDMALAMLLALALVIAPALGQIHKVLHAGGGSAVLIQIGQIEQGKQTLELGQASAQSQDEHPHASGIADLFGTHAADSDCRLYDSLAHNYIDCAIAALALPMALPPAPLLALYEALAVARRTALFEARGPPSFR